MKRILALLLLLVLTVFCMPAMAEYDDMSIDQLHMLAMEYELADEPDIERAIEVRKAAAEKGHLYSMYMLGEYYFNESYGILDYVEAEKWYRMAAESEYTGSVFDRQAECMMGLG